MIDPLTGLDPDAPATTLVKLVTYLFIDTPPPPASGPQLSSPSVRDLGGGGGSFTYTYRAGNIRVSYTEFTGGFRLG